MYSNKNFTFYIFWETKIENYHLKVMNTAIVIQYTLVICFV